MLFSLVETFEQPVQHTMSYVVFKFSVVLLYKHFPHQLVTMINKMVIDQLSAQEHVEVYSRVFLIPAKNHT